MNNRFKSIWDAIEDDPIEKQVMKFRSELMICINQILDDSSMTQTQMAELFGTSQPRVSDLRNGKISEFKLEALLKIAVILGADMSLQVNAPETEAA